MQETVVLLAKVERKGASEPAARAGQGTATRFAVYAQDITEPYWRGVTIFLLTLWGFVAR